MGERYLGEDLDRFMKTWVSNPAGKLDFVILIERTLRSNAEDSQSAMTWAKDIRAGLKSIGITERTLRP